MKRYNGPRGFTLIEVMLIIAILGLLTVFTATKMRGVSDTVAVNNAVLRATQILSAAGAYYNDNNSWPVGGGSCTTPSIGNMNTVERMMCQDSGKSYLPIGPAANKTADGKDRTRFAECGPWLGVGGWCNSNMGKSYIAAVQTQQPNDAYFGLTIAVPNLDLAKRVANKLPQAQAYSVSGGGAAVDTYVPIPGQANVPGNFGFFTGAGVFMGDTSKKIYFNSCPKGMAAHYIFGPQKFTTSGSYIGGLPGQEYLYSYNAIGMDKASGNNYVTLDAGRTDGVTVHSQYYLYTYYLMLCIPTDNWYVSANAQQEIGKYTSDPDKLAKYAQLPSSGWGVVAN
ncbi:MAG: hypothetical protein CMF50_09560 [Legionellales bacterium]|nr:hypothetical protein [Legionellales bacterium]|tara:strand:- start:4971 stop:5987 length:1017 start_codon:yes stop_codon:yes gene_type:complete